MISPIFWIASGEYGFQKVGSAFRIYDREGEFVTEFSNFFAMCDWITDNEHREKENRKDKKH